jgi:FemAB-related protein (PEP-CTERM system-associated)
MTTIINFMDNAGLWDNYLQSHDDATMYHRSSWKSVIEDTYRHQGFFLTALEEKNVRGVLPLVLMKNHIFGSYLISLPFIDCAGVLADDPDIAQQLCNKAIELVKEHQVDFLELRNRQELAHDKLQTMTHKVYFILPLNPDPDVIWKKVVHENIRNKVRKARKNQLSILSGSSPTLVDLFYQVFSKNMRDLGTPVFPKKYFMNLLKYFPEEMKIFLVKYQDMVIGGKVVFCFKDTIFFIYHSSMRKFAKLAPNNLLYWAAVEYGCENGFKYCNMGRSTVNSGPYYFKKQWGGEIRQLYFQYYLHNKKQLPQLAPSNPKFSIAINLWKRLPLAVTTTLGPLLAKHIP